MRLWWLPFTLVPFAWAAGCSSDEKEPGGDATGGSAGAAGAAGGQAGAAGSSAGAAGTAGSAGKPDDGPAPELDCGTPSFAAGTGLRRHPYLQSVTRTSTRVAWTSTTGGEGKVRFATSPDGPWTEVVASTRMFPTSETEDTEDYTAYDATLDGLTSNGVYCYEIVEDGTTLASGLKFYTAWQGDTRPVRILAFGDSGNASDEQKALRDVMLGHEFDVFLHLGDMAYGDGTFVEFEERVFDIYKDLMHRVPSFPAPGNHEYKTSSAQPYLDVYYLFEQALKDTDQERYYSFDYGDVHFVSIDSNDPMTVALLDELVGGSKTDTIADWLRDDLASSDATWKIAYFHHPPFSSSERSPNIPLRLGLLPILEEGGVDVVLCGHDHHYERTVPIKGEEAVPEGDPSGIPYFVIGSGGAGLRTATGDWWTAAVNDQKHIFLSLSIEGCEAKGEGITLDGEVFDAFTLNGCD